MRVIVTRPESEARGWVEELRRRGFDAHALPLIEIAPVAPESVDDPARLSPARFRAVMFVSGNAVRHFFERIPAAQTWPARTRAWAPGAGTAQALTEAGVAASCIDAPAADAAQFDSETLWAQVAGQVVPGDRVLIVRGADSDAEAGGPGTGRDWLMEQLQAAGAQVESIGVYLRKMPQWGADESAQARSGAADGSVWLFSSSQAIAHLSALLPGQDWSRSRAIATHPRIARAARAAGFGVVCESRPARDAVAAALESFR